MSSIRFWQALLAQAPPALTQQFVHDSRLDVIRYTGSEWQHFPNAGGPFRNGDTVVGGSTSADVLIDLVFTSLGRADEWVAAFAPMDPNAAFQIILNGRLLADRGGVASAQVLVLDPSTDFYNGPDFYVRPWFKLVPDPGRNELRLVKLATSSGNANLFFDGFGLNIRGRVLPV